MSFYLVLSSDVNNFTDGVFQVVYSKPYILTGEWEVALAKLYIPRNAVEIIWVFCDLVDYTNVNGEPMQLLDVTKSSAVPISDRVYIKVTKNVFSSINVKVRMHFNDSSYTDTSDKHAFCVVHFKQI